MIRFKLFAGLLVLLFAAAAPGQETPKRAAKDASHEERTEDVEVLRRILNRSLGMPDKVNVQVQSQMLAPLGTPHPGLYHWQLSNPQPNLGDPYGLGGANRQTWLNYQFPQVSTPAFGPFDGVYLAGQGIVYTLHVPGNVGAVLDPPSRSIGLADTCLKCHMVVSKSVEGSDAKPARLTEWDRTRRELRGQPATDKPAGPAKLTREQVCEPGTLAELILNTLARNAKNVRHLDRSEKITVVVTFDGLGGTARDRQVLNPAPNLDDPFQPVNPVTGSGVPARHGFTAEEARQLTLGDLHLKQNKPKDAIAAYERGLTRFKSPVVKVARPAGLTPVQQGEMAAELQKGIRDAYARYAQALIGAGDIDKARMALELARDFKVELVAGTATSFKDKAIAIPAKLIVTLAREALDKAGDDLAAVKKSATVETIGFPPADRKN